MSNFIDLKNDLLHLQVANQDDDVIINITDTRTGLNIANGAYYYRAAVSCPEGLLVHHGLRHVSCRQKGSTITIEGDIAGLHLLHCLKIDPMKTYLEESIRFVNETGNLIKLEQLEMGFRRKVTDYLKTFPEPIDIIAPELRSDRLTAIPFKHRADNPKLIDNSFTFLDLMKTCGTQPRSHGSGFDYFPALHRASEGWVWEYANGNSLGIYKYDPTHIQFSIIALEPEREHTYLRFGGITMVDDEPAVLTRFTSGDMVDFGITRLQAISGGYHSAAYTYRSMLDEMGCRFPIGFDPPVHWNELYDNPEWAVSTPGHPTDARPSRNITYSKELIAIEAKKAVEYNAEALYLDPGWDTHMAALIWNKEGLGPRSSFIQNIRYEYGLQVSLHCPLAPWISDGIHTYPREALRKDKNGIVQEGSICMGSMQYIDTACERMLGHCKDGVAFLMFDGNCWLGDCHDPNHGHPIPYTKHDNCETNLTLARRIKEKYPQVLIEMHDMVVAGIFSRYTPVYLGYARTNSYDSNWAFELMWRPMEDILNGRARSLYYYNLACNIPLYVHIDLRDDNEYNIGLWWYASTCRHLGIGGVHRTPFIAEEQKRNMKVYRRLKRFFTEGEFFGSEEHPEEVHFHVLKDENAVVINLFNLTDKPKLLSGSIAVEQLGINPNEWYIPPQPHVHITGGKMTWERRLPAYGTDVLEVWSVSSLKTR